MPSTYTQNLLLQKPATGEQAGVWGITANNDFDYLDNAIDGNTYIALSASSYSLNTAQDVQSQGRNKVIVWTGTLTAAATVNITPQTAQKLYIMTNSTTGGFAITFQQGNGGGFTLNAGSSAIIFCDGAGQTARVTGALYNVQLGTVAVQTALNVNGPMTVTGAATFTGSAVTTQNLIVNQPGYTSAPFDIYYRHASGPLVPLAIGTPGQVLQAQAGPGIAWATVQLSVGTIIAGSVANSVYYADGAARLAQYNQINIGGSGLAIGAGASVLPSHSLQIGPALNPEIYLDTNNSAVQQRQLIFSSNLVPRWYVFTPAAGEGGANSGSDLGVLACADNGGGIRWALYCMRASGNVSIGAAGEQSNRLGVFADNPAQYVLRVRAAGAQAAHLQTWENSAGSLLAFLDAAGRMNVTGGYLLNGSPLALGQPQTPWATNIDANQKQLTNCIAVGGTQNNGAGVLILKDGGAGTPPPLNNSISFFLSGNFLWAAVRNNAGVGMNIQISF